MSFRRKLSCRFHTFESVFISDIAIKAFNIVQFTFDPLMCKTKGKFNRNFPTYTSAYKRISLLFRIEKFAGKPPFKTRNLRILFTSIEKYVQFKYTSRKTERPSNEPIELRKFLLHSLGLTIIGYKGVIVKRELCVKNKIKSFQHYPQTFVSDRVTVTTGFRATTGIHRDISLA